MKYVKGNIFYSDGFKKGYIGFENNKIVEIGDGISPEKTIAEGIIVPTFINAHTHLGDSFIKRRNLELPKDIKKLVAPPHGLKHKLLENASDKEIIDSMKKSIEVMIKSGVSKFCDFREGGINGIRQLKDSINCKNIDSLILSRPTEFKYDKSEIDLLLQNSDGIGISSISDGGYSEIEKIAKHVKQKKKIFALHGSEACREDIDLILDLKPDFLIHMIKATKSDLTLINEEKIPVVICPRSNAFFGLKANFSLMKKIGIEIMLGTDNAMLNLPNVLDELRYLKNITGEFSNLELLKTITYTPRKALNLNCDILVPNSLSNFVVLDDKTLNPRYVSINK